MKDDKYYQIVLMLIYNGVRISELLDLKKENVHLGKQYFDVIDSKTENGIRKVPIADKVLDFYKNWYNDNIESEYQLHTEDGKHFLYRNYYDSYFKPLMKKPKHRENSTLLTTHMHINAGRCTCRPDNNQKNCRSLWSYDTYRKGLYSYGYWRISKSN